MLDFSAYEGLAELLASDEIDGAFWLVEMVLPSGTQYFSETDIFEWDLGDGTHTWNPFLDPEAPVGEIKQSLSLSEKNDTSFNLCNASLAISALIRTVDVEGRQAKIYLYFPSIEQGILMFRGIMGKPEALKEGIVSIPVVTHIHGPRVKLPSDAFSTICRFHTYFGDCVNCFYAPQYNRGEYETGTTPYATCNGTSAHCTARGMRPATAACPHTFAAAPECPYDPANSIGLYETGTTPYTACDKTIHQCELRGMIPHSQGGPLFDNFAGFVKFNMAVSGRYKSGFLGLGSTSYTSRSEVPDNFLGAAIPLVYGEVTMPAVNFFQLDMSNGLLCGGFFGDGRVWGPVTDAATDILCNGEHHNLGQPWFTMGWIGQAVPVIGTYAGDPFQGSAYALIVIQDEVGIQAGHAVTITGHIKGRHIRQWNKAGDDWIISPYCWYSDNPVEVMADLFCSQRGGLRLGYSIINDNLMEWKTFADEVITDVDGVSRKRFTFNGYITDQAPAADVLERIRKEFSMYFRLYGDTLDWGFLTDEMTSVKTFSEAAHNLIVDEFDVAQVEVTEKGAEDIPNRLYISFLDASNGWEKTTFHLESAEQIAKAGKINDEQVFLCATTNIGQALRIGSNLFERMISGNYTAKWKSPLSCLAVEVGDVVTLVSPLLPAGTQTLLITNKTITAELDINFEGELYQASFYDDVMADVYEDYIREIGPNPLSPCGEVTIDSATEQSFMAQDNRRYSVVKVDYTPPADDVLWKEVESWWRDKSRDPEGVWHSADVSREGQASWIMLATEYRDIRIAMRSVSRYDIRRTIDNATVPKTDLILTGTTDTDVPDAPVTLTVGVPSTDPTVSQGTYRIGFQAGAANWAGVRSIYIEAATALPFSDGTVKTSNGDSVSGAAGAVVAGESVITDATKDWTPDDPDLLGCLAIVEDGHGCIQGRIVTGNTATTITTDAGWYRPTGAYTYRVVTNFTLENYRGWLFEKAKGDFQYGQTAYTYDIPVLHDNLFFRVCAFNDFGMSEWATSDGSSSQPDPGLPSAPTNVIGSFVGDMKIFVSWVQPATNTATLRRYIIRISKTIPVQVGGVWTISDYTADTVAATMTYGYITAPSEGDWYVSVFAENSIGVGNPGIILVEVG